MLSDVETQMTPEEIKLWSITALIKHILLLSYHDSRMLQEFGTSDFYRQTKVSPKHRLTR